MVCCLCVGTCFSVKHHIMPDLMFLLAWRMRLYKMGTQNRGFTCEVCHSGNRRGFRANDGVFLGIDLQSLQPRIQRSDSIHAWSIGIIIISILVDICAF